VLLVPDPSEVPPAVGARVPNVSLHEPGLVVLYRNQPVVESPPGFAFPLSCAVVPVRLVGLFVDTTGAAAGVVNDISAPYPLPYELFAIAQ
jgi:hypothetical protein